MFNYQIDEENYYKQRENRKAKLLENDNIKSFLDNKQLNIDDIEELSILEKYLRECEVCQSCKALKHCLKSPKGYTSDIEVSRLDDKLYFDEVKVKCQYLLKNDEEYKHLNNFVYNDIANNNQKIMLSDYSFDETNVSFIKLYSAIIDLIENKRNKGFYICGSMGVGKTYLCSALANTLANQGHSVAYLKANDFMNKMRTIIFDDKRLFEDTIEAIKKADYVFIDDLGSENLTSFLRDDVLFNILDYRMEQGLITIINSNRNLDDLKLKYKQESNDELKVLRIIDRILAMCELYLLKGVNYRHLK